MSARYDAQWVARHYDDYGEKEWHRLTKDAAGEVKLHLHRHYLEKHVPPCSFVLEIGAGAGRFTQILAEMGARVVVADLSPVQLDLNRRFAAEHGFEHAVMERRQLDLCDLGAFADGEFDAVVCYGGPLSYVFERRRHAVREMLRVLRPGGVVLVSVMSLWGAVHQFLPGVLDVPPGENAEILRTGDLCPETYPGATHHCHMFRSRELRELLVECGAAVLAMSASNCLSAAWGDRLEAFRADARKWSHLLDMELEACRQTGCMDVGTHLIAVARKPAGAA
jgi:SAM-dependent methyltransferase